MSYLTEIAAAKVAEAMRDSEPQSSAPLAGSTEPVAPSSSDHGWDAAFSATKASRPDQRKSDASAGWDQAFDTAIAARTGQVR